MSRIQANDFTEDDIIYEGQVRYKVLQSSVGCQDFEWMKFLIMCYGVTVVNGMVQICEASGDSKKEYVKSAPAENAASLIDH